MTELPRSTDDLARYVLVLFAIILTCTGLYYGRDLLILLFTSAIFASLMLPMHNGLVKRHFPSWLAAFLCCLSMLLVVVSLIWFFAWQYSHFAKDLPELRTSLDSKLTSIRSYLDGRFHFSMEQQEAWMDSQVEK
ncbi:MAG: AI-2E family transporter, partial [Flavobacteriales bacterium]|nr:AI-2E family transporter [Flavobacteriales bacterium]